MSPQAPSTAEASGWVWVPSSAERGQLHGVKVQIFHEHSQRQMGNLLSQKLLHAAAPEHDSCLLPLGLCLLASDEIFPLSTPVSLLRK